MHRHTFFTALLIFSIIRISPSLSAQKAPVPTPAEDVQPLRIVTRNVLLDVVVTDSKGNVVNDLKQNEFLVYEDKQPQIILSFEAPSTHFLPPELKPTDIQSMSDVQKKLPKAPITILVLDELNTHFEDMTYARSTLEKYLKSQPATMPQPTSLLVAANRSFNQIHDYTLDRDSLLKAVADHKAGLPFKMMNNGHGGSAAIDSLASTLTVMQQIARATTGHPGRKNLIWVGRGFMPIDLSNEADTTETAIRDAVQQTVNRLRDARITLTSIDPTINSSAVEEVITPDGLEVEMDASGGDPFGGDINFMNLAPETGGRSVYGRNDVGVQIGNSIHEGGNYYTLSYSPTDKTDIEGKYRAITILVTRPGLIATTRNGYYTGADPGTKDEPQEHPAENPKTLAQDLYNAVQTSVVYTGLNVKAARVKDTSYSISVDSKMLNWKEQANGDRSAEVTIIVAAFNKQNKLVAKVAQEMTAGIPASKAADAQSKDLRFLISAQTPANATRVRVVVRDAANGKVGTFDLNPVTGQPL